MRTWRYFSAGCASRCRGPESFLATTSLATSSTRPAVSIIADTITATPLPEEPAVDAVRPDGVGAEVGGVEDGAVETADGEAVDRGVLGVHPTAGSSDALRARCERRPTRSRPRPRRAVHVERRFVPMRAGDHVRARCCPVAAAAAAAVLRAAHVPQPPHRARV